jgi:hypothetical protein
MKSPYSLALPKTERREIENQKKPRRLIANCSSEELLS